MRKVNVKANQSVERAIKILNCFDFKQNVDLMIDDIVRKTALSKATAYRLLWTLEKNGLIQYNSREGTYRLGYKLLEYGGMVFENIDLRREAEPFLIGLHESTKHTVLLAIRQGDTSQYLLQYDSDESFQPSSFIGRRKVLHYGALGILLMAFMPESEARRIVDQNPLEAHTPYTVTDEDEFFERLEKIRNDGYFVDVDEMFVGFTAITAPIYSVGGDVVASAGVAGPTFKLQGQVRSEIIQQTIEAAYDISKQIGRAHV